MFVPGNKLFTLISENKLYRFRLYISYWNSKNERCVSDLRTILKELFGDDYSVEVIDILGSSHHMLYEDDIIATPTLVKYHPEPARQIIGDLASRENIMKLLE